MDNTTSNNNNSISNNISNNDTDEPLALDFKTLFEMNMN